MNTTAAFLSIGAIGKIAAAISAGSAIQAAAETTSLMAMQQGLLPGDMRLRQLGWVPQISLGPAAPPEFPDGSASCTASACTFTGYGLVSGYQDFHLTGNVTLGADRLAFEVSYLWHDRTDIRDTPDTMTFTLDGSVSVEGPLDGNLQLQGAGTVLAAGVAWDVASEYHTVAHDNQGCLTSGLLHATARYDVAPVSPHADWDPGFEHQASASFGIGCF